MQMLGLAKKNGLYLGLLLIVAGCGSSSNNNNDARGTDGRVYDAGMDRGFDGGVNTDGGEPDASDAAIAADGALADGGKTDAHDTAPPLDGGNRDGLDAAIDGGLADGPTLGIDAGMDGAGTDASVDGGFSVDGGVTTTFVATLTGAQETPPTPSTVVGSATFTLSADRTQLAYHVIHSVAGGTQAHIHLGAGGEPGPVVFPLTPFSTDMSGIVNLTPADAVNLAQGMFYVNVHSTTYPNGEVRGQILKPGETLWVADLTGSQETPAVTTTATGHASLIVDSSQTSVRYHVSTTGLTPTAAQIQDAIAGQSGNIVYQLTPVGNTIDGTQTITGTDMAALTDRHWYVNVLTSANGNGELRGQFLQPGEVLYIAALTGAQETPPVTTSATGYAQFVLDPTRTLLRYEALFTGLSATASHIHLGAIGMAGAVVYPLTLASPTQARGTQAVTSEDVLNLDAGLLYINAHTAANPNGEIRGQIGKP